MTEQSKKLSMQEAGASVGIGLTVNYLASFILFPLFGLPSAPLNNLGITLCFTALAIARTYFVRRYFAKKGIN